MKECRGIIKEQYLCREPEERVFFKGRWYEGTYLNAGASEEDKRQYGEFQKQIDYWVNWKDGSGKRAFVVPVERCSTDVEVTQLDRISFADWLRQNGFNSERLVWYCDYACRDDYGLKLDQTSAWAGLFYFCSRVRRSGDGVATVHHVSGRKWAVCELSVRTGEGKRAEGPSRSCPFCRRKKASMSFA